MADRKRILLLHHDEDSLITLQWILENQGYDTTATWDHAEAAGLLKSRNFDIVVLHEHALKSHPDVLFQGVDSKAAKRPHVRVVIPADSRLSVEHIAALAQSAKPVALAAAS
jgi:DNA-binding response OmpR family regulator